MRRAGALPVLSGALLLSLALQPAPARAANETLPVEEFELANGMRFLLLERPAMPTVEAGWVVSTGAADDPGGATGISHFIEHMMFKGTRTIGSRDIERELEVLARLAALDDEVGSLPQQKRRLRTARARERSALEREAKTLLQLGAFSLEYSRVGATRLNANTAEDLTLYYVTLPAETLELWFWLESDRLSEAVFREFSKEKRVVAEERRQRIESTPTGTADRLFDATFWRGTPYSQPTLGHSEDLTALSRTGLADFFAQHYHPQALTAVLVGNFAPARVKALAEIYFGRLEKRPELPATKAPIEVGRNGSESLDLTCACPAQVKVRYATVPFGHVDQFALQALAGVLNGRAGRLYRNLVLGQEIAFAAFAQQTPLRRGGSFTVTLEAKGDTSGQALLAAWDAELGRLSDEPPSAAELGRVKRRLATEHLNQLKDPHLLMRRLLIYAGLGDWRQLADWTSRLDAIAPEEVSAAARRYLLPERRLVGFYRQSGANR